MEKIFIPEDTFGLKKCHKKYENGLNIVIIFLGDLVFFCHACYILQFIGNIQLSSSYDFFIQKYL